MCSKFRTTRIGSEAQACKHMLTHTGARAHLGTCDGAIAQRHRFQRLAVGFGWSRWNIQWRQLPESLINPVRGTRGRPPVKRMVLQRSCVPLCWSPSHAHTHATYFNRIPTAMLKGSIGWWRRGSRDRGSGRRCQGGRNGPAALCHHLVLSPSGSKRGQIARGGHGIAGLQNDSKRDANEIDQQQGHNKTKVDPATNQSVQEDTRPNSRTK